MVTVEQSYRYCLQVARGRAKNFYYSFVLLSAQQRKAMCAIYAFMRYCDDLSDEPGATRGAIDRWRAEMEDAFEGRFSSQPVWPAFHHTVRRFGIPHDYFRQMIDGISSDLEPRSLGTFDELYRYCYQVASVVGLGGMFGALTGMLFAESAGFILQTTGSYWSLFLIAACAYPTALAVMHFLLSRARAAGRAGGVAPARRARRPR